VAGTFTGRRILAEGLGLVIAEPSAPALAALLQGFAPGALRADRARLLARPATDFVQSPAELGAMLAPALRRGGPEGNTPLPARATKPLSVGGKGC
jgi:succinoglycan biosynthesis protein ExoL